jgi:hypothetical protein
MRSLTNCENPSSNPLQGLVLTSRQTSVTLKIVPKAAFEGENCSESRPLIYTGENLQRTAKERRHRNLMRVSEQFLVVVFICNQASRNFILIFS